MALVPSGFSTGGVTHVGTITPTTRSHQTTTTGADMRSFGFLIAAATMVTLFIGIVLASVTLTAVKETPPLRHASLVLK